MSSSSSSSDSDSGGASPVHNGLRYTTTPAAPSIVHGINIQSRVPIVLDLNEANYTAWARAFSDVFGQYGLADHVDGSTPQGDDDWVQNDCAIVSWFYNRIASDLLSVVSNDEDTAYSLLRGVRNLFRDNSSTRAVYFGAEFRSLVQGDQSVLDYVTSMKKMADRLAGLGSPVPDKELVHNIVRGLNPRLHHAIPHITYRKKLPSFHKTRSMLQLEEHRIAQAEKMQAAAALFAQANSSGQSPTTGTTGGSSGNNSRPPAPASSSSKKKKKKQISSASTSSSTPAPAPTGFFPTVNPWTGMVQAWPFPPQ